MTMTTVTEGTEGQDAQDESRQQQAFYARIDQLYRLFADWTGQRDDDDEAAPKGDAEDNTPLQVQSTGAPCITAIDALSTMAMFVVRVGVDAEMDKTEFLEQLGVLWDNEEQAGADDDESESGNAPS